ncbi:hypothetical protein ACFQ08_26265 [Streptosporangium algeriense]|uniref:Secreted protein n=1 Tax=Streptosporangium algeriense TaxID=1682748 RepID=A0ABW3DY34_9ACTN
MRSIRRIGVLAAVLPIVLPAVAALIPDAHAGPPISNAGSRTSSQFSSSPWATDSARWAVPPSGVVPDLVTGGPSVILVAFGAEGRCVTSSGTGACEVAIEVGGQQTRPRTVKDGPDTVWRGNEWKSRVLSRTVCVPYQESPRDLGVRVLARSSDGARFELRNRRLKVERRAPVAEDGCS